MPIKPENRGKYLGGGITSKEWRALRERILEKARRCCERCKAANHAFIERSVIVIPPMFPDEDRLEYHVYRYQGSPVWRHADTGGPLFFNGALGSTGRKPIKVVLTVAHLDQNPLNNDEANLAALCQRCHLNHDRKARKERKRD